MIRRTLVNRALRQRNLARTLIARHPLAAQDQRQPRLADRPAASIDDASWPAQAPIAAELVDYNAAPPAAAMTLAEWPTDLSAFFNVNTIDNLASQPAFDAAAAIAIAASTGTPEDVPTPPAAGADQHPNVVLADLVHRMRDPGWAAPASASPAATQTPDAPAPSGSIADLIRRMRAPGWVPPEAASPETTQLPPAPTPSNPQANSMRDSAAVSPAQPSPAPTTQSSAAPEQTANERIADIVREMWPTPQRSAGQRNRPRTPLGQRMAEAGDFGQKPVSPQQVDPKQEQSVASAIEIVRLPAIEIAPDEPAADRPPAGTGELLASVALNRLPTMEIAPVERSGDAVAQPIAPIAPSEPAETPQSNASVDGDVPDVSAPTLSPPPLRQPSASAPGEGEIVLPNPSLPPAAPPTLSQMAEINTALSRASAIAPSQAPAASTASQPEESLTAPLRQNVDSPPDVEALTPPLPRHPAPSAPGEGKIGPPAPAAAREEIGGRLTEPTLTQQTPPPSSQLPTRRLGTGEPMLTQSAEAALAAAAQVTAPIAPDQPAATSTTEPSAQASLEIRVPPVAATDLPRALTDRVPVPVVAVPPADHAQTNAEPARQIASEAQRSLSEANTLAAPAQAAAAPTPTIAKTQFSPSETAQESQPPSFQKPESGTLQAQSPLSTERTTQATALPGLPISNASVEPAAVRKPESGTPQIPSSLPTDRPAQAVAHPGLPISSASVEPAADRQSISDTRTPQVDQASLPQGRSESAPTAPERGSPQDWAARLSPAEPPVPARIADSASSVSEPNAAQQPVPESSNLSTAQIDIIIKESAGSARQPMAAPERAMPTEDRTAAAAPAQSHAAHQNAPAAEARVSPSALVQPEHMPALSQPPRSTQSADNVAGNAVPPSAQPVAPQAVETPLAHSNDMQPRPNALPATNNDREIATARVSEAAAAIPMQEPHSALPSPDPRSPIVRDTPAAAAESAPVPTPEPGTPAAWAARFARHRDLTEPQPEPTAVRTPAAPIAQPTDATTTPANADAAVAPELGTPAAWAARFARHRDMTEPQAEPTVVPVPAMPIEQLTDATVTPANVAAAVAPEPGTPQAWAARFARHRTLTEPQPEPLVAPAPAMPSAEQAPIVPSESQAIPAAPARLPAIVEPARGAPTRFVPARRVEPNTAATATRPAATARSADVRDASTAAAEAPTPGTPAAWAARFTRHRDLTEPQPEPTAARPPAMPIAQPMDANVTDANVDAAVAPELGTPAAWAARFARHRDLTEPQAEPTAVRAPAMPIAQPNDAIATPANADAVTAPEPNSPQAWAARFTRHRDLTEPQAEPTAARAPATEQRPAPTPPPIAHQTATPAQRSRAQDSVPQAALRHAAPTPIAETTRRFLKPIVGIDPATVRVFRGPQAEQVTAAYKAEALASGDTVALSAQHSEDTPAALGVLAHELTHIARQRDTHFVPPLAQKSQRQASDAQSHQSAIGTRNAGPTSLSAAVAQPPSAFIGAGADEEALAQSVETQVQQLARTRVDRHTPADATPAAQPAAHSADWGSLPAPWEPLPEWMAPPRSAQPAPVQPVAARNAVAPQPQRASIPARETAPVQLAEASRSIEGQPAQSAPEPAPSQAPEPDLDALARQVYAVLKQRLAAERRRAQS